MLQLASDSQSFATGCSRYQFDPLPGSDTSARIMLEVRICGCAVEAVLDTGTAYLICSPDLAELLALDASTALDSHTHLIRGTKVKGQLHRIELALLATEGNSLTIEVTAFIPDRSQSDLGVRFPSFLGFAYCLEWTRFAVDPATQTFYFGAHP